jgi:hypothetical protein
MTEELEQLNQPYDAQQLVEEIAEGEQKAPKTNLDADYEAAKAYSTGKLSQPEADAQSEATSTTSQFSALEKTSSEAPATGNPEDYLQMARETNPRIAE